MKYKQLPMAEVEREVAYSSGSDLLILAPPSSLGFRRWNSRMKMMPNPSREIIFYIIFGRGMKYWHIPMSTTRVACITSPVGYPLISRYFGCLTQSGVEIRMSRIEMIENSSGEFFYYILFWTVYNF